MRRYHFLDKELIFEALNKLRAAFLAAKDGDDVELIINALLTTDEKLRIGRRIQVAQMLKSGMTHVEIAKEMKVGLTTVNFVSDSLSKFPGCFDLVDIRERKVERVHKAKAYGMRGGGKKVFKSKEYTGFSRKNVKR